MHTGLMIGSNDTLYTSKTTTHIVSLRVIRCSSGQPWSLYLTRTCVCSSVSYTSTSCNAHTISSFAAVHA
jgi:hypothetical protein